MQNLIGKKKQIGKKAYLLASELFPICRSITGSGLRQTLNIIKKEIPINVLEVPSGTKAFDWTVPEEWNIRDAFIADEAGKKIIDFQKNNLHVVGYSTPIDKKVSFNELQKHLYSLEDQPKAIPYITSYYKRWWGFCLSHEQRMKLKKGKYRVRIDSDFKKGSLTYGEIIIPGRSKKEIFLSTYICHPSMANNEISGPSLLVFLAKWILSKHRKYTYRLIFIPETIGSIVYLSKNIDQMKKNIIAGFNITCVGDDLIYSFLPSRQGNTLADRAALNVLKFRYPNFIKYSFLERGSDERQYCSPGIDLPVVSIMRTKYGEFPEYHTSLDDLNFISESGLQGSYDVLKECLEAIENNEIYHIKCLGEPHLGKRKLYPTISTKFLNSDLKTMMDFIVYADGTKDLLEISNIINVPVKSLISVIKKLQKENLLEKITLKIKTN
ncbi:MAG: DUF4910 domain-containing protein [Candidatus Paceibacterota bacterium]|jgi:aminopeptidase-like protein